MKSAAMRRAGTIANSAQRRASDCEKVDNFSVLHVPLIASVPLPPLGATELDAEAHATLCGEWRQWVSARAERRIP